MTSLVQTPSLGPSTVRRHQLAAAEWHVLLAALLIWFFALLAPYYGTLNALIGALTSPCIAFIFPALAFTWYFRKAERRKQCSHKPPG